MRPAWLVPLAVEIEEASPLSLPVRSTCIQRVLLVRIQPNPVEHENCCEKVRRNNAHAAPHVGHRAAGTHPGTDAPHSRWNLHGGPAVKTAIAGNFVLVVLFFAVIVWRLFFAGRGNNDSQGSAAASLPQRADGGATVTTASSSGASTPCASPRMRGLRKEDLLALPVFIVQGASAADEELGGGVRTKQVECAVCISEFTEGDAGRLLPRCGHHFHAECVDRWFQSHITCPLCRAVVADGGSGKHDSKAASVLV